MLHDDMNVERLMMYAQSIEKYKLGRISRNLRRSGCSDQSQRRFKTMTQIQDGPSVPKLKLEKGGGSQKGKSTCATYGNRHYEECLRGTGSCFVCFKDAPKSGIVLLDMVSKLLLIFQSMMLER